MSASSHSTPGEGDVSRAYFLLLTPPPPASAEERSAWDTSRWSTRRYRWPYPSTRYSADKGGPLAPDGSPESIPFGETPGRPSSLRGMGYLVRLGIDEEDYDAANSSTKTLIVQLLPDTGSDLAWSLGVNPCEIAYFDTRTQPDVRLQNDPPADPTAAKHTCIQLTEWIPAETRNAPLHSLLSHDLDFRTPAQWRDNRPEFGVHDADHCEAYLIGRERGITFNCYDSESDSINDVTLKMRWAIAYAVNSKLRFSDSDGVLGLSLYDHQDGGGEQRVAYPGSSFLYKVRKTLPVLRNPHALVIYFTARPHPRYHPGRRVQSWVAFNRWPASEKPTFSRKISVHCNAYGHHCWSVTLLRIEVQRYIQRDNEHDVLYCEEYPDGLEVLVDSGSSTSELPYRTVNAIHTTAFQNSDPLPLSTCHRPTYHISRDVPVHLYRMRLVFKGDRGQEGVVIYAPFEHFVCARDLEMWPRSIEKCPWKGAIFAAHQDTPFGVLGLNFFQTTFISFHKSSDSIHYLRMATQGRDVERYQVRFPSDSDSDD